MFDKTLHDFIIAHGNEDVNRLALQQHLYSQFSKEDWSFILQQIEGRQRAQHKLPSFHQIPDIIYPRRLSIEQCSSELTTRYKLALVTARQNSLADLTAGFGIDTWWLSQQFTTTHYVEQNADLCRIARHNFDVLHTYSDRKDNHSIIVHNESAQQFLDKTEHLDWIYIDPARRDTNGKKVFRISDCEPDILTIWDTIKRKSTNQMIKLSPMIDLKEIINSRLQPQHIHVVAVANECKEVLVICGEQESPPSITATNILDNLKADTFTFTLLQETMAKPKYADKIKKYLYEPNAALMKAGAYKIISLHYNIDKLAPNSHLYTSDMLHSDFQGRVWEVTPSDSSAVTQANVLTRNYPMTAESLKKKLRIKDGGTNYIICTTLGKKHIVIHAKRLL